MYKSAGILIFVVAICFLSTPIWSQVVAPECPLASDPNPCEKPNCRCFSESIPGTEDGNTRDNIPQIVYLTFDDAVNVINYAFYEEVLFERTNPNGAAISATFFITHEYNDYNKTHQLYLRGHDIALHSITHQTNPIYWAQLNQTMWAREFGDQRTMVARFANIPANQIKGMRAPFLQLGGDDMFQALVDSDFQWECSRPTWQFRPRLYPYTNDYKSSQDCAVGPCPVGRYPGFWTVPLVDLLGGDLFPCAMVDTCLPVVNTTQETFDLLRQNFQDHYLDQGNKAPFGIFTHAAWLVDEYRKAGYIQFLDYLKTLPDVYIVSISKAVDWMRNPVPVDRLDEIESWKDEAKENNCPFPVNCRFSGSQTPHAGGAERYMMSCVPCATIRNYPWLNNPLGN